MSHSAQCHCNNITLQGARRHCVEEQLRTNGTVKKGWRHISLFSWISHTKKYQQKLTSWASTPTNNLILRDTGHFISHCNRRGTRSFAKRIASCSVVKGKPIQVHTVPWSLRSPLSRQFSVSLYFCLCELTWSVLFFGSSHSGKKKNSKSK